MKYFFYFLLFLFLTNKQSFSQNLVPNGDFEQYSTCPVTFNQIDSALFWTYPTEYSSSDYFNTCVTFPYNVGVPVNQGSGYQYARSGNGYAGIFLTFPMLPDTREYIEVPLTAPLIANGCYHFEMYVNILNACKYSTDAIGVYFSDTLIKNIPGYGVLPYTPQINGVGGAIYDTLNWH